MAASGVSAGLGAAVPGPVLEPAVAPEVGAIAPGRTCGIGRGTWLTGRAAPPRPAGAALGFGTGGTTLFFGGSTSPAKTRALLSALFTFAASGLGSTNRPIQTSVSGYENAPTVKVTRAIHSVSCAGAISSSSAARLARIWDRIVEDDLASSVGLGLDAPGLAGSPPVLPPRGPWYSRYGKGAVGPGGVG